MSDDKVADLNNKQNKNPKDAAVNQMKEAVNKEYSDKIKAQAKKAIDAAKVAKNEKTLLNEMLTDFEEEKAELNELLKDL